MAITVFQGEKNLTELAEKLFSNLSKDQLAKVEHALLRENPHLKDVSRVNPGSILKIPAMPDLNLKPKRALKDPESDNLAELAKRLKTTE